MWGERTKVYYIPGVGLSGENVRKGNKIIANSLVDKIGFEPITEECKTPVFPIATTNPLTI